ncbi:MAG TPA: PrsW family intramembrane metalloprotease [Burkholderiales bacterium]|nr:PrsW family intramembrane metalloprotease [Burkholderiales bacterium]
METLSHPQLDRMPLGAPLRRRGVCLAVSGVLAVVLVFAALVHLSLLAGLRADVASVFYRALALSSLLAAIPLAVLWFLDRRERESPWLFAAAFLWGGCIATALALPFNTAFFAFADAWVARHPMVTEILGPDAAILLAAPISAPIAEELAKALGVLLVFRFLRAEFDNMRDGLVYGALVGLGFNWFESALYVAQGYAEWGVAPYGMQLGARYALFGFGGHALFTGLFGAFLGLAIQTRRRWLRVLAPIAGLALAIAAHMLNNALPLIATLAGAAAGEPPPEHEPPPDIGFLDAFVGGTALELTTLLPFVAILAVALWRSGVWERRVIREELADEVGRAVSPSEYAAIVGDRMFRTRRIDRTRPRTSGALVNAQHELAFRKRRVRDEREDPERDRLVAGWREEIRRLRGGWA